MRDIGEVGARTFSQDMVSDTPGAHTLSAHGTPLERRVARRAHSVIGEESRKARSTTNVAADLDGAPDDLCLVPAHPVDAHEMCRGTRRTRLTISTCSAFCAALNTRLLVPVEPGVAEATPPIHRENTAFPGKRRTAVACVVRQEHPRVGIACSAERRVECTRRTVRIACWG